MRRPPRAHHIRTPAVVATDHGQTGGGTGRGHRAVRCGYATQTRARTIIVRVKGAKLIGAGYGRPVNGPEIKTLKGLLYRVIAALLGCALRRCVAPGAGRGASGRKFS